MTLWMEVDVKNNELPTGRMAEKSTALAKMCGIHLTGVSAAVSKAKKQGRKCKYVRVEIDDEQEGVDAVNTETPEMGNEFLRGSPCDNCPRQNECKAMCADWESWFRRVWRELRWAFLSRKK